MVSGPSLIRSSNIRLLRLHIEGLGSEFFSPCKQCSMGSCGVRKAMHKINSMPKTETACCTATCCIEGNGACLSLYCSKLFEGLLAPFAAQILSRVCKS